MEIKEKYQNFIKGNKKETKLSLILFPLTFVYLITFQSIALDNKIAGISILAGMSFVFSLTIYLISKYYGSPRFWGCYVVLRKKRFYKASLALAFISWSLFVFSKGGENVEIKEYINSIITNSFETNSTIRFIYESNIYISIFISIILAELLFSIFCPVSLKGNYEKFSSELFHSLSVKKQVKTTLKMLRQKKEYLFDKNKENIDFDISSLENYTLEKPSEIYDILNRHSYLVMNWIGYLCTILMLSVYTIPCFNISLALLNYYKSTN
tara:strand:- start:324 stop:1127 length:804 start_codon:yes stop_codon:yes gene_type:complete